MDFKGGFKSEGMTNEDLKSKIRSIENWPKQGVIFRDITPVLEDKNLFGFLVDSLAKLCQGKKIDKIVGIDARGFIFASALAYKLGVGLAIVRKKGKLPGKTIGRRYSLEYAANTLQMHEDSIKSGEKVLICDDVLATGGTVSATIDIIKQLGGEIAGLLFFIELIDLGGRGKLMSPEGGPQIDSLIKF